MLTGKAKAATAAGGGGGQERSLQEEADRMRRAAAVLRARDAAVNSLKLAYNWTLGFGLRNYEYSHTELPLNLAAVIDLLCRVHAHEIIMDGAFNGDPHPGNILLCPDGRLGLIDYGQVKHLDVPTRVNYAKTIVALAREDRPEVVRLMGSIFDFPALKAMFKRPGFKAVFDGMHGVTGGYFR